MSGSKSRIRSSVNLRRQKLWFLNRFLSLNRSGSRLPGLSPPSWASHVIRMRCPDDSDQSGKVRIRPPSSFILMRQSKIFLKLLGVTRTWIRILGSRSVKNLSKPQYANDSGSKRGPDPRIIPNWMRMHLDPDSWIPIQEFLCGPQIRIGSVPYGMDPLLRIWLG